MARLEKGWHLHADVLCTQFGHFAGGTISINVGSRKSSLVVLSTVPTSHALKSDCNRILSPLLCSVAGVVLTRMFRLVVLLMDQVGIDYRYVYSEGQGFPIYGGLTPINTTFSAFCYIDLFHSMVSWTPDLLEICYRHCTYHLSGQQLHSGLPSWRHRGRPPLLFESQFDVT